MPRKREIRDVIEQSSWMIPYANLMTILMIFFLILYGFGFVGGGLSYEKALTQLEKNSLAQNQQGQVSKQVNEIEATSELQKNLSKYANVEISANRIKIMLPSPVLFDSGQSELKQEAIEALSGIAKTIKDMNNSVIVEGYTDNVPVSGAKFKSNRELSSSRAFSVIKYFIENEQIGPERFTAYGYGESKPISANDTEENRAKNRRIEISIVRGK